jgi:DNA-binding NarL/FixJ family response regulator
VGAAMNYDQSFRNVSSILGERSSTLSPRKCALLVARGLVNKEIARELGLREGPVKQHVHNIFLKLGMRSRHTLILHVAK